MSEHQTETPQQDEKKTALIATGDSWWNDNAKFNLIQRAATMFASSPLVPKQYQGPNGIGSCVIALNMANRMNADPLMVMQNLYVVHGRPAWSAQFLIACFNQTGRFSPLRYEWSGTEGKDDWGCTAWSTDRETGEKIIGPRVTIDTAKKEGWYAKQGSKWQTIPRLMLMYRAAGWLVRTHAPEIAMGLRMAEEEEDAVIETTVIPQPVSVTAIQDQSPRGSRTQQMASAMASKEPEVIEPEMGQVQEPATEEPPPEPKAKTKAKPKAEAETTEAASSEPGPPPYVFMADDDPAEWFARTKAFITKASDMVLPRAMEQAEKLFEAGTIGEEQHAEIIHACNRRAEKLGGAGGELFGG